MAGVMRFDIFWEEYCADRTRIFEIDQSAPPSAWDIEALERRVMGGRKPKVRKNDMFSKLKRWFTKRLKQSTEQANQMAKKVPGVAQAQDLAAQGIAQASKLPGMDLAIGMIGRRDTSSCETLSGHETSVAIRTQHTPTYVVQG